MNARPVTTGLRALLLCCAFMSLHADDQGGFGGDWDWGAIEGMDDTPISANAVIVKQIDNSRRLSVTEVTAPDRQAEPHPAYPLFKGMPAVEVIPSVRDAELYPCANCHQNVDSDPSVRVLKEPHDKLSLQHGLHGKGQFWCFTCHDRHSVGQLSTLKGEPIAFEDAYILCSQCHVRQARDWGYGAHGKRLANWSGKRQVYNCTACHYQHAPAIALRDGMQGPAIRQGLPRPAHWNAQAFQRSGLHAPKAPWLQHNALGSQHEE